MKVLDGDKGDVSHRNSKGDKQIKNLKSRMVEGELIRLLLASEVCKRTERTTVGREQKGRWGVMG